MPTTHCTQCGQRIEYPDELGGQEIACPTCNQSTRLPGQSVPAIRLPKFDPQGKTVRDAAASPVGDLARRITDNIEKVVVGKRDRIQMVVAAYLAEGHVLLEDVPGVAKTMLARALARSVGCTFKRMQCTPDLLPNDITGASIFNPKTAEFEFRPGPLFAQIVLADEINRATPRAQSALLEAMAERQVTADGLLHRLEAPFFVIATQNPVDHEGTFPLPEAQLDRFLVRLSVGYPGHEEEVRMLERLQGAHPIDSVEPVATASDVLNAQRDVLAVFVDPKVRDYVARIVRATREHEAIVLGGSPRASLALCRASQAWAAIHGYDFVLPDDVKDMASHVLAHRLIVQPESRLRRVTAGAVVEQVLDEVEVPVVKAKMA